eukprot:1161796-Pelagomonas_calceolata.AAC.11
MKGTGSSEVRSECRSSPCAHAHAMCMGSHNVGRLTMCTCALWLRGSCSCHEGGRCGDALDSAPGVVATWVGKQAYQRVHVSDLGGETGTSGRSCAGTSSWRVWTGACACVLGYYS